MDKRAEVPVTIHPVWRSVHRRPIIWRFFNYKELLWIIFDPNTRILSLWNVDNLLYTISFDEVQDH